MDELEKHIIKSIRITPNDLEKLANVRIAYERILEKDLSNEIKEIEADLAARKYSQVEHYVSAIRMQNRSRTLMILNAGLIQSILSLKLSSLRPNDETSSSILGLMLGRRMHAYTKAYAYLLTSLCIGTVLHLTSTINHSYLLGITLPLLLILSLTVNQKILEYRINKGYFGNNASEAKEFISFISAHSDKSDFNDGDKMKKLLPNIKSAPEREVIVYGGEATA